MSVITSYLPSPETQSGFLFTPSSLNKPFGSGIVTPSGILLNSQILDFSWPNKTKDWSPNPVIVHLDFAALIHFQLGGFLLLVLIVSVCFCSSTTTFSLGRGRCPS